MCVCVLAMMETINTDRGRKLMRKTEDFARETKTFLKKFKNSKMNAAHRKKVKTKKKERSNSFAWNDARDGDDLKNRELGRRGRGRERRKREKILFMTLFF